jgi:hypothetical protein
MMKYIYFLPILFLFSIGLRSLEAQLKIVETRLAYKGESARVFAPGTNRLRLAPFSDHLPAVGEPGTVGTQNGFYSPVMKKEIVAGDSVSTKYEGYYGSAEEPFLIVRKGNDLWYRNRDVNWKIIFSSDSDFFNVESVSLKTFYFDSKGSVRGFYRKYNGTAEKIGKLENPDTVSLCRGFCRKQGFVALLEKEYALAIYLFEKGVRLYDRDVNMMNGLGYAYLFKGDYANAIKILKQNTGRRQNQDGEPAEKAILEDFIYFKSLGFAPGSMSKVLTELNIDPSKQF